MGHEAQGDGTSRLIAKCWADESFKQALSDEDLGKAAGGIGSFFDVFTERSHSAPRPKP